MIKHNKIKIVILVLSSNQIIAFINRLFQKLTWAKETLGVVTIFYLGGHQKTKLTKKTLKLPSSKKFEDIGKKTIDCFEWVERNLDYDVILRTSASSYVDINQLINFLEKNYDENLYSGVVAEANYLNKSIKFASGSGYLLSKKNVELIIQNKELWNHKLIDDVALADFLSNFQIYPKNFERNTINVFPKFNEIDYKLFLTRCILRDFNLPRVIEGLYMIKLKNNYKKYKEDRKNNIILENLLFYIVRFIQKIYPRKYFSKFQNRHYKKYLKDLEG